LLTFPVFPLHQLFSHSHPHCYPIPTFSSFLMATVVGAQVTIGAGRFGSSLGTDAEIPDRRAGTVPGDIVRKVIHLSPTDLKNIRKLVVSGGAAREALEAAVAQPSLVGQQLECLNDGRHAAQASCDDLGTVVTLSDVPPRDALELSTWVMEAKSESVAENLALILAFLCTQSLHEQSVPLAATPDTVVWARTSADDENTPFSDFDRDDQGHATVLALPAGHNVPFATVTRFIRWLALDLADRDVEWFDLVYQGPGNGAAYVKLTAVRTRLMDLLAETLAQCGVAFSGDVTPGRQNLTYSEPPPGAALAWGGAVVVISHGRDDKRHGVLARRVQAALGRLCTPAAHRQLAVVELPTARDTSDRGALEHTFGLQAASDWEASGMRIPVHSVAASIVDARTIDSATEAAFRTNSEIFAALGVVTTPMTAGFLAAADRLPVSLSFVLAALDELLATLTHKVNRRCFCDEHLAGSSTAALNCSTFWKGLGGTVTVFRGGGGGGGGDDDDDAGAGDGAGRGNNGAGSIAGPLLPEVPTGCVRLFHGSSCLRIGNIIGHGLGGPPPLQPNCDFGPGFYATPVVEEAHIYATDILGGGHPAVLVIDVLEQRVEADAAWIDGQLWQDTIDFCKHKKAIRNPLAGQAVVVRGLISGKDILQIVERRVNQESWWFEEHAQGIHAYTFDKRE
jgi:hypothetical protein